MKPYHGSHHWGTEDPHPCCGLSLFLNLLIFTWRIIAFQTVLVSAIYQHESAISIHMFPPSWTSLLPPTPFLPLKVVTEPSLSSPNHTCCGLLINQSPTSPDPSHCTHRQCNLSSPAFQGQTLKLGSWSPMACPQHIFPPALSYLLFSVHTPVGRYTPSLLPELTVPSTSRGPSHSNHRHRSSATPYSSPHTSVPAL